MDNDDAMRLTDPWMEKLSPAIDGELSADEQALLDAHMATCAECPRVLAELRAIAAEARTLPEIAPPSDLWPGVEQRIAAFARSAAALEEAEAGGAGAGAFGTGGSPAPIPMPARARSHARPGGLTLSWPQLAAAGLLLVALSGGGVWVATHGGRGRIEGMIANPAPGSGGVPAQTASAVGDPTYAAQVAELERALDQRRGQLDPGTVRTIESNLHIIDEATTQARQALASDPSNPYLKDYLSRTMKRKVDLLKQATVFASTP